jgi:DNA-binding beta-propeller fold protein YncE
MRDLLPNLRRDLTKATPLFLFLIALVVIFQAGTLVAQERHERPVMMDSNGSGSELYVLDASSVVHEFRVTDDGLQERGRISLSPEFIAADMTYASSRGRDLLLIAGAQAGQGVVLMYSLDGKQLKSWSLQNVCSGIDFGTATHSAYVATSDSSEIYQLDASGSESTYVTRIADATRLGPLAFDEARKEIYVADVARGRVYQYSMTTKAAKVLAADLSAPTAVTFEPESRRLYIADPGRKAIFTVDTKSKNPSATPFASDSLKAPYGLALISKGRIAVADYGDSSVLVFSSKGALLFRTLLKSP